MDGLDDASLVARIAAGEVDAFAALVRRHQRTVLAVALAITGDRARAEDLTQEALMKAWRHVDQVREPGRIAAWLCGVVRAAAKDAVRRDRRRERLVARHPEALGGRVADPAQRFAAAAEEALVLEVLAELPDTYREPLLLHYLGGCSIAEMARALALGEDAVKQRLSRGRQALRAALARRDRDEPRFAHAALALAPGVGFTDAVVAQATPRPPLPVGGKESFMRAHAFVLTGALALALAGGVAVARSRSSSSAAPAWSASVPAAVGAPVAALAPRPASSKLAARAERLRAIRAARGRTSTAAVGGSAASAPASKIYDFAGERLVASDALGDAAPPPREQGPLDKRAIRAALVEVRPAIRACYQALLAREPEAGGTLTPRLVIEAAPGQGGVVSAVDLEPSSTLAEPALVACVLDVVAGLDLPAPDEDATVTVIYPYLLAPR